MKILKLLVATSLLNLIIMIVVVSLAPPKTVKDTLTTQIAESPNLPQSPQPTPVIVTKLPTPQQTPTAAPAIVPTPAPTPPPIENRCLIQIDGSTYDVTSFRRRHSGGDVFQCGTDMSAVYWSRHGKAELLIMQMYKI